MQPVLMLGKEPRFSGKAGNARNHRVISLAPALYSLLNFLSKVSLCNLRWLGIVGWTSVEVRNLPTSASQVMGLKVCATTLDQVAAF